MAFCATITLLLGLNKIIEVLGVIGPIIVILTLATAVSTILDDSLSLKEGILLSDGLEILRASENWFFSAILYAVFSLPGLYGFLPLVGATIKSNFEVKGVALLGPFLFISAMTIVVLALIGNIQSVYNAEVPILILATKVFPVYGSIFAAVIFLGIYTTVTPLMWTICRRFADEHTLRFRLLAISLTLICWFGGNLLPFGQLINLIYPSIGYIGLILMACLIYKDVGELINKTS